MVENKPVDGVLVEKVKINLKKKSSCPRGAYLRHLYLIHA
ncbi:unnamed protein product [Rhodiola kirilowii]